MSDSRAVGNSGTLDRWGSQDSSRWTLQDLLLATAQDILPH